MWRQASLPAVREKASPGETLWIYQGFIRNHADPPGWKPRLYVSQDGRDPFTTPFRNLKN
jgi:hypothetical protein